MKHSISARWITKAFILLFPAVLAAQESLGERVYFDAMQVPLDQWETAAGTLVARDQNALVLKTDNNDEGWITSKQRLPYADSAALSLSILRTIHCEVLVQVEWFREDGTSFLSAADIYRGGGDKPVNQVLRLSKFLPDQEKPAKFRIKFWVTGKNAVVYLSQAIIHVERTWKQADMQLMRAYGPDDAVVEDEGLDYKTDHGSLAARLEPQATTASIIFWDRINLNATGIIMFDLESISSGSARLHALCWNDRNEFLKEVSVTPDIDSPGLYEIPITAHQQDFPTETARMSFKVWLSGKETSIRLAGIYYGVSP
jgi:hypothetical protein